MDLDTRADRADPRSRRAVAAWLFTVAAMIVAMVVIGGVTRLTHSGLSMVEWWPLSGWLPPLGEADWQAAFAKYRQYPEFATLNPDMTLAGFKGIFWLEYIHRLWGRLIAVVFLVPFLYVLSRGWIAPRLAWRLAVVFVLGAVQGLLGWYMVKSGLVDRPDVSQYRLAAHLGLALVIYGYLLVSALDLARPLGGAAERDAPTDDRLRRLAGWSRAFAGLVFLTILSGAFVAGLDAGLAYNTFPLMDGRLLPDGLFPLVPAYLSVFEDVTTAQFDHRVLALSVLASALLLWSYAHRRALPRRLAAASHALLAVAVAQVALGISTLILFVPVALAAAHQAGAVALFSVALWVDHECRVGTRPRRPASA